MLYYKCEITRLFVIMALCLESQLKANLDDELRLFIDKNEQDLPTC